MKNKIVKSIYSAVLKKKDSANCNFNNTPYAPDADVACFNVALFEGCKTLRGRMDNRKSSPDLYSLLNKIHNPLTKTIMPLINSIDNAIRLMARTKDLHHELLIADKALVRSTVRMLNDVECKFSTVQEIISAR